MVDPTASQIEIAPGRYLSNASLRFTFARSGGPGGQNVNKTATAATLSVTLEDLSAVLPEDAMTRLTQAAGHRLAGDRLMIRSAGSRSQYANRRACLLKLRYMVEQSLNRPKIRKARRTSKRAHQRRIEAKRIQGKRKSERREGGKDWS